MFPLSTPSAWLKQAWSLLSAASEIRRLLEPIGNIPPAEAEQRYYAMLETPTMAA